MNNKNLQERLIALSEGDYKGYYLTCVKSGLNKENSEDPDMYERGLAQVLREDELERATEESLFTLDEKTSAEQAKLRAEEKLKPYKELVERVRRSGINIDYVLEDTASKRKILKEVKGYRALKGKGGSSYDIDAAPASVVGSALKNDFYTAKKKLKLFDEGKYDKV